MSKLRLTFYGDDLTGSTDALEQLAAFGVRAMLFIEPPTRTQLKKFPNLQALGVAGMTRALTPGAMEKALRPAFQKLKALGARHVHYKICSTFDSSPQIGNLGRVMDVAAKFFPAAFIPLLVATPALGRYTIFGNHFARFGIGSEGEIHRLDRHPAISRHPITPMNEGDLRLHLAKQTKRKIALFDILTVALPAKESRAALKKILTSQPPVVLFDAIDDAQIWRIGGWSDEYASAQQPLFSIGASGIEMALGGHWAKKRRRPTLASAVKQVLVGSGSCSPVTEKQILWALKNGFAEVGLDAEKMTTKNSRPEIMRATNVAVKFLQNGRSVIVHTTKSGADQRIAAKFKNNSAKILGTALGVVLRGALAERKVRRLCIAGGDTSSFAARALGVEALEMHAPLTPGAPLCRAFAPQSPADGMEIIFKGGQVGAENYFKIVKEGGRGAR